VAKAKKARDWKCMVEKKRVGGFGRSIESREKRGREVC